VRHFVARQFVTFPSSFPSFRIAQLKTYTQINQEKEYAVQEKIFGGGGRINLIANGAC
jgi:hypothetical protein